MAPHPTRDWVAIILAIGLCTALNGFVFFALFDAVTDPANAGLSENSTQILTGWGGGIIGILGTVFGVRIGTQQATQEPAQEPAQGDLRGERPADTETAGEGRKPGLFD